MITESVTRIAPLEPPYDAYVEEVLDRMMHHVVPPIALFRTLAKNLPMTEAMHGWGTYELGRRLSVPMRDREIVIDRVTARCGAEYEWGVHVAFFAGRVGLTAAQVASLTHGSADDACWTEERDRVLIRMVDALHDGADLDDELWSSLSASYDEAQVLDLLLLAGWYHAISFVARATRIPLEDGSPRFGDYAAP